MPHNPINVGDLLPAFTLLDQNDKPVSPSNFKGQPLVIFFYPKDHTPGCTAQACDFRNYESEFQAVGAQVIGINDASVLSHRGFSDKYNLTIESFASDQFLKFFSIYITTMIFATSVCIF